MNMVFKGLRTIGTWVFAAATAAPAAAASRRDLTWLPCGSVRMVSGEFALTFAYPRDHAGVIEHPFLLLGVHVLTPTMEEAKAPSRTREDFAILRMKVGDQRLPEWRLEGYGTAYVISPKTMLSAPRRPDELFEIRFNAQISRGEVFLYAFGAPDPLLLSRELDGLLTSYVAEAKDPELRTYFQGLADQFANRPENARRAFRLLREARDPRVAQYARRGLRVLRAASRPRKDLERNFARRYRWGLYLQQCGFFQPAMEELRACSILDASHVGSWFRLSEMAERCHVGLLDVSTYADRAAAAAAIEDPTVWNVLITFLRERAYEVDQDGQKVRKRATMSDEDVRRIKDQWTHVEKMVFGASRGTLRLNTAYHEIRDEKQQPFVRHAGWLDGPADDVVEVRGWFDSVISVRPHLPGERAQTGGGDVGPNGAGLSDVPATADWQMLFRHWNHQFDWAMIVGECGPGYPITHDGIGCGHAPIPSEGYGLRAAMRYYVTPAMYRHAKIVPTVRPTTTTRPTREPTYARYWRFTPPVPIDDHWPSEGFARPHVTDPWRTTAPAGSGPEDSFVIDSETNFVDLKAALGDRGWSRARGVCWIFSPALQHLQLWLGHNDAMAVWVNGRGVHRRRYAAIAKYLDSRQVDMVSSAASLERGWNRVEVVVESWPSPYNKHWGFSMRLATFDGRPVPGLRFSVTRPAGGLAPDYVAPEPGYRYRWDSVEPAFHELLPNLSASDLARLTGLRGLEIRGGVEGADGMVAIHVPRREEGPTYRPVPKTWDPTRDQDTRLNNVLDWAREDVCAVRFEQDGQTRDLLILKPEAFEAYLTLLKEPPEARQVFGQIAPADRVLGYVTVPATHGSARTLLAVDVLLSNEKEPWPIDEEDLLDPDPM